MAEYKLLYKSYITDIDIEQDQSVNGLEIKWKTFYKGFFVIYNRYFALNKWFWNDAKINNNWQLKPFIYQSANIC